MDIIMENGHGLVHHLVIDLDTSLPLPTSVQVQVETEMQCQLDRCPQDTDAADTDGTRTEELIQQDNHSADKRTITNIAQTESNGKLNLSSNKQG